MLLSFAISVLDHVIHVTVCDIQLVGPVNKILVLVPRVVDVHCNQVVAELLFFLVRQHVELLGCGDDALDVVDVAGGINIHL